MTELWYRLGAGVRGWLYRHSWQLALLLAALIVLAAGWTFWPRPAPRAALAAPPAAVLDAAQERWVIVHVTGAVVHPGLYRLNAGLRVSDALVAAGGVTESADPARMPKLAAHLRDGKQIVVPERSQGKGTRRSRVNINTASRDELLKVPGIDGALAEAIIAYRERYGGFRQLAELKSGLGVDRALYQRLQRGLIAE